MQEADQIKTLVKCHLHVFGFGKNSFSVQVVNLQYKCKYFISSSQQPFLQEFKVKNNIFDT